MRLATAAEAGIATADAAPALDLLSFAVGGAAFGVDAATVAAVGEIPAAADDGDGLFWFHEEMGWGSAPPAYRAPVVLTLRHAARPYRVVVDQLKEVASVGIDEIRLLPPLVEPLALRRGIWGALWRDERMVLLVDFMRLPHCAPTNDFQEEGP